MKKNEKIVQLPAGDGQVEVTFPIPANLKEGELHRGEIALRGAPDPFEDDDRRYFTFRIRPPMKVLLISDRHDDANFVASALDPDPSPSSPRTFLVNRNTDERIPGPRQECLESYACIFLLNVAELDQDGLGRPERAMSTKGAAWSSGRATAAIPENYNEGIPGQILPAQIERTGPAARDDLRQGR